MKKFDIRICRTETLKIDKPEVFLNFNREDTAYYTPLYDLIVNENMECVCGAEDYDDSFIDNCEMVINVVTDRFISDAHCMNNLRIANDSSARIVSLLFFDTETEKIDMSEFGECISLRDISESVEEYMLTAIYSNDAIKSYVGNVNDEIMLLIKRILYGAIIPPNIQIGDDETMILAIGSMGYSTIQMWNNQGFDVKSDVVIVERNKYVGIGQPDTASYASKWIIGTEEMENATGKEYISILNREIMKWLQNNAVGKKLILIGGLGKSSASLLLPLILIQANKLHIDSCVACTLPFEFEGKRKMELASRSLAVLKEISTSVYYRDNSTTKDYCPEKNTPISELFELVGYSIAIAVNDWISDDCKRKGVKKIFITKRHENNAIEKQIGTYGRFEILVGGL